MSLSKKLIVFFILIILLFVIYIAYRDLVHFSGQYNYKYIYYGLFIIIFLLFLTLLISENLRKNFILLTFSLLFSLYLIEIIIYANLKIKLSKYLKDGFDQRTKYEAYVDLKKEIKNIYPAVFPTNFIYKQISNKSILVPFGNISNKKILWCNENGYYTIFNSDQYGFRNPNNIIWKKKFIEYTLIGDSYVEGACVNDKDTISEKISSLGKKNVLNLGRGGNGPFSKLAVLLEYSKLTEGSKVLWFYYEGNDFNDMREEKNSEILNQYFIDINFKQNLKSKQEVIDNIIIDYSLKKIKTKKKEIDHNLNQYSPVKILRLFNLRYYATIIIRNLLSQENNGIKIDDFNLYLKIIKKAKQFVTNHGADFYLVYLPSYNRYAENFNSSNYMQRETLLEMLKDNQIDTIDMASLVFNEETDVLDLFPLRKSGHYNEKGYEKVSKAILAYFKKN